MRNIDRCKINNLVYRSLLNSYSNEYYNSELEFAVKEMTEIVEKHLLPIETNVEKSSFETLGFKFNENYNDALVYGELPIGWMYGTKAESSNVFIFDHNKRQRVIIDYESTYYGCEASMILIGRYNLLINDTGDGEFELGFGNIDEGMSFVAGKYKPGDEKQCYKLYLEVKKYADENYPDWKDVAAYWETPSKTKNKENPNNN